MTRIAIVDHGAGNLVSIEKGLRMAGASTRLVARPEQLAGSDAVVLPGVGSGGAAMRRLREAGLAEALRRWPGPMLGICVGLQLLFERSAEDGTGALAILPGTVERLPARRLPHVGWNDVAVAPDPLFSGIPDGTTFYFVHSYAPIPRDPSLVIGTAEYAGQRFVAAVRSGRHVGVQFHPERSGSAGMRLLANFVGATRGRARAA